MYIRITKILNDIKTKVIAEYNQRGLKASGSFANNLTIGRQGRYKVVLTLPFYSQFIMKFKGNKGGSKGNSGPLGVIEQWIRDKGFPLRDYLTGQFMAKTDTNVKKVAFLIKRKIKDQGTDIHMGKRQPIDLDKIINDELDYQGNELADRILQQIKI